MNLRDLRKFTVDEFINYADYHLTTETEIEEKARKNSKNPHGKTYSGSEGLLNFAGRR